MTTILYVILAIFVFGLLIFIHEGGHFLFARLFNVSINEFAIGMGPKLISKTSRKTGIAYSLRAFPIGGFVSMVGEDEESDDPNALNKKPVWQRIIIVAAGAVTNLVVGFLVMAVLVFSADALGSNTVSVAEDTVSYEIGLRDRDVVTKIDNTSIHTMDQLVYQIARRGVSPIDITVQRDGETVVLQDVQFATYTEQGVTLAAADFKVYAENLSSENGFWNNLGTRLKHTYYRATNTVTLIWESLFDLVTGKYSMEAVSGPIGVTEAMVETANTYGAEEFINLAVTISMNLGIMNLLPFPALDGGRLVFLIIEAIRRKPVRAEIEGYVHFAGIVVLMLFMLFICAKDIVGLFV